MSPQKKLNLICFPGAPNLPIFVGLKFGLFEAVVSLEGELVAIASALAAWYEQLNRCSLPCKVSLDR